MREVAKHVIGSSVKVYTVQVWVQHMSRWCDGSSIGLFGGTLLVVTLHLKMIFFF